MPSNTLTWCKSPAISNPLYFQKNNGITLIYTNIFKIVTILSRHCKGESSSVNTFVMYPPKPLSTKVLMSLLTVLLALGATFGNGSILAVIARFKSFRTVPNTLLANLAVVDMLNIAINMPIYMISVTLEAGWFRGQSLAIMSSFFNRLLIILNLASMLALMADMYFAMAFDLKCFAWKSTYKAVVSSFISSGSVAPWLWFCFPSPCSALTLVTFKLLNTEQRSTDRESTTMQRSWLSLQYVVEY